MSDHEIEQEIKTKGLTAPRVTLEQIEAEIADEVYFTAKDGFLKTIEGCEVDNAGERRILALISGIGPLPLLTFCVLVMKNGFTVTGESACASPENFDAEIGRKIARENAINKLWPLLGYELKSQLSHEASQK